MSPELSPSAYSADDRAWQIERYVLADPTLDRPAFEAAMADDVELALAVARSVAQMQGLALACRATVAAAPRSAAETHSPRRLPRRLQGLALAIALAAAWLVAFVAWQISARAPERMGSARATAMLSAEQQMAEVARQWIDMDSLTPVAADDSAPWQLTSSDLQPTDLTVANVSGREADLSELESHASTNTLEESDWMLQVSAAFFEESES